MFGNIKTSVATCKAVVLIMLTSFTLSWADVPAPPVNQNLGIPDSQFNNLAKENCWYCHAEFKLSDVNRTNLGWTFTPPAMKPGVIERRHHARIGKVMGANTQAPFGKEGDTYRCISCHIVDQQTALVVGQNHYDCLNCHKQLDGKASVHHLTAPAQAKNCKHCHGSLIDNPDDGHYIPLGRVPASVTPRTSGGKGPNGEGACTFCHNEGVEAVSGIPVKTNAVNHHSTGVGQVGVMVGNELSQLDCTLCHDQAGSDWAIRRCEDCHGIASLHTIQADTNNDGNITVYGETAGFGHIGQESDCIGCHGGYLGASNGIPYGGPVVPQINDLGVGAITAGSATQITIKGLAFTNNDQGAEGIKTYTSSFVLTDYDGIKTELTPDSISATQAVVTLPPNLAPGSYAVRAVKESLESAPVYLVVTPDIVIEWAEFWEGNTLTVEGHGFGSKINSSVTVNDKTCDITSWTDTLVVAECPEKCGKLVLKTIFGTATDNMYGGCETASTPDLNPTISAIDSDYYWDIVTLDGSGFGNGTNASVTVNGDTCKVTAWSDTKIVAEECPIRGCDTLIAISDQGSFTKLLDCN